MLRVWFTVMPALLLVGACADTPDAVPPGAAQQSAAVEPDLPPGLVAPGSGWDAVTEGYVYTESPVNDGEGGIYFAEPIQNRIYRVSAAGAVTVFAAETGMAMGLTRRGGRLYACRNRAAQIVVYQEDGSFEVLLQGATTPLPDKPAAPGEFCNDVAVRSDGHVFYTDRVNERVMHLDPEGRLRVVATGFRPNGIVLSADEALLAVTDSNVARIHAFRVAADGSLTALPDYFAPVQTVERLGAEQVSDGRPGTNGMTVDADGRFYVTSFYGIQVFAADGSYLGVIDKPAGFISNLVFAGPDGRHLYATGLNGVYRREMLVAGATD